MARCTWSVNQPCEDMASMKTSQHKTLTDYPGKKQMNNWNLAFQIRRKQWCRTNHTSGETWYQIWKLHGKRNGRRGLLSTVHKVEADMVKVGFPLWKPKPNWYNVYYALYYRDGVKLHSHYLRGMKHALKSQASRVFAKNKTVTPLTAHACLRSIYMNSSQRTTWSLAKVGTLFTNLSLRLGFLWTVHSPG